MTMTISIAQSFQPQNFYQEYWQKKPLLIKQGLSHWQSPLEANEIAGLSLEEEVDARIIQKDLTKSVNESSHWQFQQGPFSEDTFSNLPDADWTLLVQGVDQWVPELGELLNAFRFIPRWRLDDVMVSFAAPGGSVGPHFDHYDVFLIQADGKRQWHIGKPCTSNTELLDHKLLKILSSFEATQTIEVEPGDILYIPATWSHYGASIDQSISYSVGFRAPSLAEMTASLGDFLLSRENPFSRYFDPEYPSKRPSSGEIPFAVIQQVQNQLQQVIHDPQRLALWFGGLMTELKYPLAVDTPDPITEKELLGLLASGVELCHSPTARLAYFIRPDETVEIAPSTAPCTEMISHDSRCLLFANGTSFDLDESLIPLAKFICNHHVLESEKLFSHLVDETILTFVLSLVNAGILEFVTEETGL